MKSRYLFKKKKLYRKMIIPSSFLLIIFFFIYLFIFTNKNEFIVISKNTDTFYIIPEDRGGEKVQNLDKKSLNSITKEITQHHLEKPDDLLFSIQFFTNSEMVQVNEYLQKIINFDESIYSINDFYILTLKSEIGTENFLLYKNFTTRLEATNYCVKFLPKEDNCLVVDATKF